MSNDRSPDLYVGKKQDVPKEPHWAIIQFSTVTIPGDERSRQHPGHGYPEHKQLVLQYEVFLTEEKWKRAVAEREKNTSGYDYVAMKVLPAKVQKNITVDVNVST